MTSRQFAPSSTAPKIAERPGRTRHACTGVTACANLPQMSKLKNSNDGVYEVLTTATDGKAWITGFGAFLWVTTDAGASYQTVNIPRAPPPLPLARTALTRTQRARRWWRS